MGGGGRPVLAVADLTARLLPYAAGLRLQEALGELRRAGAAPDTLLLVQHEPVYTIGKRGSLDDFRGGVEAATARGATIVPVPRGGETTYHGPGQLVAYPVVGLRGLGLGARAYVEALEDAMIGVAGAYGVAARGRVPGATGVWVGDRKLGAVGVRISRGVTSHGAALNVDTDLAAFSAIVPCGAPDAAATSLAAEARPPEPLGLAAPGALLAEALARGLRCGGLRRAGPLAELHPSLAEFDAPG
ncbi:MAG: hypothetical protein J3K34DRAFT_447355 [Monoraphidium minutum]|nr:MAG: hypothetical protein J3K34DRAFT_447355 [Monoraphidium minutum]